MKKPFVLLLTAILFAFTACVDEKKPEWSPAPNPLMTRWAASVDPAGPWPEYPRPQMQREEWMNLNGLWDYQLVRKGSEQGLYAGKILVPYPVESALSGIADSVGPGDMIFYRRYFEIPRGWTDKKILLHFEAVDWETRVYINGNEVGSHRGGYDPFSFDISQYLNEGENEITVEVSDPTNEGYQPRGKQVLTPGGILYTPSSGIWQTVWIEPVPQTFVSDIKITPDIDNAKAIFDISVASPGPGDQIHIRVLDQGKVVSEGSTNGGTHIIIPVNNPKPWSPSDPFLYDLEISVNRDGKLLDKISSYFGMRKIEKKSGPDGFVRLYLNGEALFHNGPLDQGFWPDGLYTPPTDEAMKFDVEMTKKMGFNMLRKHVKVENRRFYYWCDKLGIMVWQDMPSTSGYVAPDKADLDRPEEEREQFTMELEHLIMTRYNHPSIVMWVPFNEGWGQFDTEGIVGFIKTLDSTRLVNNTSGWADRGVGDVKDIHNYPDPAYPEPEGDRASVLGEFGGLGLFVQGHTWEEKNWGYRKMDDSLSLLLKYEQFYTRVWDMKKNNGLSASVYTQTTDVETETNGLMTYDREVVKMDPATLHGINTGDYVPAPVFTNEDGTFNTAVKVELTAARGEIRYTLDGSLPDIDSKVYTAPVELMKSAVFSAAAFDGNRMSMVVTKSFTLTEKKPLVYMSPFDNRYSGGGFFALIDGKYGSLNYSDGKWQGFRTVGLDAVVDLGAPKKISSVSANFLVNHEGWIFLPTSFKVFTSDDMKQFTLQGEITGEIPKDFEEARTQKLTVGGLDVTARYVRISAPTAGPAPAWLTVAKGRPTWLFIDEVVIE